MHRVRGVEYAGIAAALFACAGSPAVGRSLDVCQGAHVQLGLGQAPFTAQTFSMSLLPSIAEASSEQAGVLRRFVATLSVARAGAAPHEPIASIDDAQPQGAKTNYKGQSISAAATRFYEDFDDGQMGPEWAAHGPITTHQQLGMFSYVPVQQGMTLNLLTKEGEVYEAQIDLMLFSPSEAPGGTAEDEESDNMLIISVDGQDIARFTPGQLRGLRGASPEAGGPVIRKIRVPFTAGFGIAEVRIQAADPGDAASWSCWAVDNILVDLGLQDPVFGVSGDLKNFEPGFLGLVDPRAGLTGELPPAKRYGNNDFDFSTSGGSSGGGARRTQPEPVPTPSGVVLGALAGVVAASQRRRRPAFATAS